MNTVWLCLVTSVSFASASPSDIILQHEKMDFPEIDINGVSLEINSALEVTWTFTCTSRVTYKYSDVKVNQLVMYNELLKGNVLWKLSTETKFAFIVKIYTKEQSGSYNDKPAVVIETKTSNNKIYLSIYKDDIAKLSPLKANSGDVFGSNALMIFLIIFITLDHKVALLIGIFVPLFNVSIVRGLHGDLGIRCNITVLYPRNLTFENVNITVESGTIRAPPTITTNNYTSTQCLTEASITGCPSCCHGNGVCHKGNICRCYPGFDAASFCEKSLQPKRKLFINDLDPRLSYLKSTDGMEYLLLGRRRSSGTVKSLTHLRSRGFSGNDMSVSFKHGKHVKEIMSNFENNQQILLKWLNKCIIHLSYWRENTVIEKLKVNVCSQVVDKISSEFKLFPTYFQKLGPNKMNYTSNKVLLNVSRVKQRRPPKKARIKIPVEVRLCGRPDTESTVYADVIKSDVNKELESFVRFKAIPSYIPGEFEIKLPVSSTVSASMRGRMCKSFKKISKRLCSLRNIADLNEDISYKKRKQCNDLSYILQGNNVTSFSAFNVTNVCLSGIERVDSLCNEVADLLKSKECEAYFSDFVNYFTDSDTPLVFSSHSANGDVTSSPVYNIVTTPRISATENLKTKIVLEGNDSILRILNFTVSPKSPKSKQRYKVAMNYSCARQTTKVHMRVEGSDNYSNYVTCNGIQRCNCCVLHVAAALSHVTDTVIVNVSDATLGFQFKKQFLVKN